MKLKIRGYRTAKIPFSLQIVFFIIVLAYYFGVRETKCVRKFVPVSGVVYYLCGLVDL